LPVASFGHSNVLDDAEAEPARHPDAATTAISAATSWNRLGMATPRFSLRRVAALRSPRQAFSIAAPC
jgi:hypothetical protein